jgi:hypothetical protein
MEICQVFETRQIHRIHLSHPEFSALRDYFIRKG